MKKLFTFLYIITAFSAKADYWTQKASYPGAGLAYPFSFSVGNKGYVGCGKTNGTFSNDFWEYDPTTNAWTQKANFGGTVRWAGTSGFSIANKGYVGLGMNQTSYLQDFWEYNPVINIWTQKANFGGGMRSEAVSFSIGSMGYAGTGEELATGATNDLWQYNPATDTWVQKAYLSLSTKDANCFVIGNNAYILGGCTNGYYNFNWQYNSISNSWTQKADLPAYARCDAAAFSICDKGYWGIGELLGPSYASDLWQYNPITNIWIQKANFPGLSRDEPAYFSIGSKGYIGLGGQDGSPTYTDFWEYTPDSACATGIEEIANYNFQFTISPNPAHQYADISWSSSENKNAELLITTLEGKKVYETKLLTSDFRLPTSDFPKGIYLVQIISNKKTSATQKLVVE